MIYRQKQVARTYDTDTALQTGNQNKIINLKKKQNIVMKTTITTRTASLFHAIVLCLSTMLAACTGEHFIEGGVTLSSDTEKSQTYYADERYPQHSIKFTAESSWTASVNYNSPSDVVSPVSENNSSSQETGTWITLSTYKGEAGEREIDFEMNKNTTGAERTAYIEIYSGSEKASVKITQSGKTAEGEIPASDEENVIDEDLPTYDGARPFIAIEPEIYLLQGQDGMCRVQLVSNITDIHKYASFEPAEDGTTIAQVTGSEHLGDNYQELLVKVQPNMTMADIRTTLVFKSLETERIFKKVAAILPETCRCYVDTVIQSISSLKVTLKATATVGRILYWVSEDKDMREEYIEDKREYFFGAGTNDRTVEDSFEGLLPGTTYYITVKAYDYQDNDGEKTVYETCTKAQESKHDLVFEVSANYANNFKVYLPIDATDSNHRGTIDWGDGTVSNLDEFMNEPSLTVWHEYKVTSPTTFTVRFSGTLTKLEFYYGKTEKYMLENTITAVKQWGYTGLKTLNMSDITSLKEIAPDTEGAFRDIKNFGKEPYGGGFSRTGITRIPDGLFDHAVNAETFDDTFFECENLEYIPEGLFSNCTKVKSFYRTFYGCTKITEIPATLFANNKEVEKAEATFARTGITAIPEGLFDSFTKAYNFQAAFSGCEKLENIPESLFAKCTSLKYVGMSAARDTYYMAQGGCFNGCKSLKSIPAGLFANNPGLEDAGQAFYQCDALTEVPASLFANCKELKYVDGTFGYIDNLTTVPVSLFDNNRRIITFRETFIQCRKMTGESPYTMAGENKVHIYERSNYPEEFVNPDQNYDCFEGCELLDDYEAIPDEFK